ncbi:hypothetical protein EGW08_012776, partial [Elysia chlorotica]
FLPPISGREQRELRLTFKVMTLALDLFNVTYFLCEGSMLGAFRHHGFIPWDDDIDVCLNGSDWLRVKQVTTLPASSTSSSSSSSSSPSSPSPAVRVPYIDMFFFTEDADYIWAMSPFKKHRILYKKAAIFPLLRRPFENNMAPVPRDYLRMCSGKQYDASVCVSRDFDH